MNLEELQTARDRERQTDKLQQLRETFYADAGEFIQQLRAERDRVAERVDDPFDAPEVSQLTDEINTAEQTVEAIYEKRVGKIVKAASFAAADLPAEAEGMTTEEQDLFETLVGNIKENREHVLDVLAGEPTRDDGQTAVDSDHTDTETGVSAADLMGSGTDATNDPASPEPPADERPPDRRSQGPEPDRQNAETAEPDRSAGATPTHQGDAVRNDGGTPATAPDGSPASRSGETGPASQPAETAAENRESASADRAATTDVSRRTVRITDDIDTFVGSDARDYDLESDDIVTLPESNADLLLERDVATEL